MGGSMSLSYLQKGFIYSTAGSSPFHKRDKLGNATDADYCIIEGGNTWVHTGNALRDAELYGKPSGRMD